MENKAIISLDEYDSLREVCKLYDALRSSVDIICERTVARGFEEYRIISVRKKDLVNFFNNLDDTIYDDIKIEE
jgi:hypothetical protein